MEDNQGKVIQLLSRLESLLQRQETFQKEINDLQSELNKLKTESLTKADDKKTEPAEKEKEIIKILKEKESATTRPVTQVIQEPIQPKAEVPIVNKPPTIKADLEKFIGENLINKIGIVIIVIGVGIGAKYAIDNQLISPLARIILGYLMGIGLLGFAIQLKTKYQNFSAVLLSGSLAIMYFITYSAYSFYDLIPQVLAFALMVLFTVFTVIAAINYNRQVIALIGLVGAYAVPFLLSEDSGRVAILFTYIAIINTGILVLAFNKYWKSLYYSSFALTWIIYFSWYSTQYNTSEHFGLAMVFMFVFFVIFYLTFLAYKLIRKEEFTTIDILLLLGNSFIFFGFGYASLSDHIQGEQLLGLFTLVNGILHFIVSAVIYKQRPGDKNLLYFVSGLVMVFIAIAIPVQLDGNWVTLLWAGEATLLFWIGRTKNVTAYENLSYPLMILAFLSIIQDWTLVYNNYVPEDPTSRITPLLNIYFLTSLLFIAAFSFINLINNDKQYTSSFGKGNDFFKLIGHIVPAILLIVIYFSFRVEITTYWNQLFTDSTIKLNLNDESSISKIHSDFDLLRFKTIWIYIYSLFFFSILSLVNIRLLKKLQLGMINLGLSAVVIIFFLFEALFVLSELRDSYLVDNISEYYKASAFNIVIRYISFGFVGGLLYVSYIYIHNEYQRSDLKLVFNLFLHITVLWIASSELINWMDISGSTQSYKLGLSILWGVYALFLITLGIWKRRKHLRIGAIGLFGITLIKLFFYDISDLDTISKTIVFLSLGILLLIISFLYNKYTSTIFDESES